MRGRAWQVGSLFLLVATAVPGRAASATTSLPTSTNVMVVTFEDAGFRDVFAADPRASGLASLGGAALVSQRLSLTATLTQVFGPWDQPYWHVDAGSLAAPDGTVDAAKLGAMFEKEATAAGTLFPAAQGAGTLIFVSRSPSMADVRAGDELGVIIVAVGTGPQIQGAFQKSPAPITALTSDSTRRAGLVTTSDIALTIAHITQTPVPSAFALAIARRTHTSIPSLTGALILFTKAPAPFDLYQRYRDQRRLTVPIGVAAGVYAALAGAFAFGLAYRRRPLTDRTRLVAAWLAISIVPLALGLLEVGRLPRLTYAGVIPFLALVTVALTTATVLAAERWGSVRAIAGLGAVVLLVLGVEAAMDWPGAVTPLLGGSQLDGGRFFGSPNAFIGLVLAAGVLVAIGTGRAVSGAALLFVTGLVIGSPWFGSDLGGAITMCAAAGLWWGSRSRASFWRTALLTGAAAVVGGMLAVLSQRYLASSPTHITQFAEGSGHAGGVVGTFAERLRISAKLLVTHPLALLPVAGVPVALRAVLRPGPRLARSLEPQPILASAVVIILLGSVIAFAVNDTGASALGLGFGSAVAVLLFAFALGRDETVDA